MNGWEKVETKRLAQLAELLRAKIADNDGWLDFENFMQLAMHDATLGYYAAGKPAIGAQGDFITAPELGDLFGRCLAKFIAACLPASGQVLELGAGSGKLADVVLNELTQVHNLTPDYLLLETSFSLRNKQDELLGASKLADSYQWISSLPQQFSGVILANEVFDSLPCQVLTLHKHVWHHYGVGLDDQGAFIWKLGPPAASRLTVGLKKLEVAEGYILEINLQAEALVETLATCLESGVLLIIDYGFGHRELRHRDRRDGTLLAHSKHQVLLDVLSNPGANDLTSHVDFATLADAAARAGANPAGFTTQSAFLLDLGILDMVPAQTAQQATENYRQSRQLQTLLMPQEMGDLFKVLAVTCGTVSHLPGFGMRNRISEISDTVA